MVQSKCWPLPRGLIVGYSEFQGFQLLIWVANLNVFNATWAAGVLGWQPDDKYSLGGWKPKICHLLYNMDNDSTLSQELLLSLKHPHVVELLDAFEGSSSLTVITELLKGAVRMADFLSLKHQRLMVSSRDVSTYQSTFL